MTLSEFWFLMEQEFGASYSRILAKDLVLGVFGDRTACEALEAGEDVRQVWLAICDVQQLPPERRLGPDRPIKP
ncbi:MAG: DUF3046 domain-containing protein [Rothia sp. (in: high G+C Gram-positive bacteria)]|nr:DUF3046 domain-containing protein [Rothia sp. (in: high G+C Gram-positive bacteria)]